MAETVTEKLKSRKFWVTIGTMILLLFAKQLGVDIDESTVWGIVASVTGYNVGQGYVDGQEKKAAAMQEEFMKRLAAVEARSSQAKADVTVNAGV